MGVDQLERLGQAGGSEPQPVIMTTEERKKVELIHQLIASLDSIFLVLGRTGTT